MTAPRTPARFPIVMIGASAGGLEAFKRFFAHMPPDCGMAFVLIPHLDPTHKSLMAELLARQTAMPAVEATDRMVIRPNRVYVIPPNKYLAVRRQRLVLSVPPAGHAGQTAIDFALHSLAEDQGANAIGIVLSGTGSHGTAGLRDIKLAGGLVIVQDPASAQHDQMPRNALAGGVDPDYVLPPEQMPDALIAYGRERARGLEAAPPDSRTLEQLRAILAVLQGRSKIDFRLYRKNMILRRVLRRMTLTRVGDLPSYLKYLRESADEVKALRRDLLIGVTTFFREPEAFRILAEQVLPELIARASPDTPIRVWVPACSTGEEAFSLAILLAELFRTAGKPAHMQIFATDVDEDSLQLARRGVYPHSIETAVSAERLQRYFVEVEPNHYQVAKPLRDAIVFAPQNLLSDPPFSKLDLISCRNALIYLEPEAQARVIALFHFALNEGGCLMLGPAESTGSVARLFEPISRKWRLFRRISGARRELVDVSLAPSTGPLPVPERLEVPRRRASDSAEAMRRLLLEEFTPAAVMINRRYQILSVQGPVVRYLQIPSGELTQDLLAMARDSLRAAIRSACEKALRTGGTVRDRKARVRRNGSYVPCVISVRPLQGEGDAEPTLLVVFEDGVAKPAHPARGERLARRGGMRELEEELRATRTDLQRTIAELEDSNEDLRASNEEVMSMNEELQSTNEELESSKEELQSLNEELTTVNNQLEDKVSDLDAANNDLANLVTATDLAIVFLDQELRVRRYTQPAGQLLQLLPGDIGRPISHFAPKLTGEHLPEDARRAISTATPVEREIAPGDQRWYLRRIVPYRVDGGLRGVVITFVDVTRRVEAEGESRRLAAVLRDSNDAVMVVDLQGRITAWNRGAEATYGYSTDEARGMTLSALAPPEAFEQTLDVLRRAGRGEPVQAFETRRQTRGQEVLDVSVSATVLRDEAGKPNLLALTERDITSRRRIEEQVRRLNAELEAHVAKRTEELQASERQIRAILNTSADAIIAINAAGTIVSCNKSATTLFGYSLEEVMGQNIRMLMPPREAALHDGYLRRYRETRVPRLIGRPRELSARRKDNVIFPIRLSVSEVEGLDLFVGCIHDQTLSRRLQKEVLNIAMLEQERIGQELHDHTQQELTGLGLLAQSLREMLTRQGAKEPAELAGRLADGMAQANLHVRGIARGLVAVPIESDQLVTALNNLASATQQSYGLQCRVESPQSVKLADATTATHLYRIAQEAVGNAVKHAKADTITIRLGLPASGSLQLEVQDNGVGFDPQIRREGAGLRLMEHRCNLLGGSFAVGKPESGTGTVVSCTIPHLGTP